MNFGAILHRPDYYPFGERWSASGEATTNRYLFSGKEKQTAGNLQGMNLLDFGARMYDPEIPRWLTQDPLAEEYYSYSPYVYCGANPVSRIDPNGQDWYESNSGNILWRQNTEAKYTDKDGVVWFNIGTSYTHTNGDGSTTTFTQRVKSDGSLGLTSSSSPAPQKNKLLSRETVLAMQNSDWSRENAQKYWDDPSLLNGLKYLFSEIASQWANPTLVVSGLSAGITGLGAVRLTNWKLGAFKTDLKWQNQMNARGWTMDQIAEAISSGVAYKATNFVNKGNTATRYVHPKTKQSVVVDNITREVIHVGGPGFNY